MSRDPSPRTITWLLERTAFAHGDRALAMAAEAAGHAVVDWNDEWWATREFFQLDAQPVVFHGSLNNAARIREELPWRPGAWCNTAGFACTAWYPQASRWLLSERWNVLSAETLVADPAAALASVGTRESLFVRPDSPLKPFSGRVVRTERISLAALDFGFYFDDPSLPVVISSVRRIEREWRFVIAGKSVLAGCAYVAQGRAAIDAMVPAAVLAFAEDIAGEFLAPDPVYLLDLCEADGRVRMLEINPFSGGDIYGCDPDAIVSGIAPLLGS